MSKPFEPTVATMLEGIPHSCMLLDASYRLVAMNRLMEAMTGFGIDRVKGLHGELILRSNTGNHRGQLYQQVMKDGEAISVSGDILNCYRRKIPVRYTVSRVSEPGEQRKGLMVIAEKQEQCECMDKHSAMEYQSSELVGHSPKMQKVLDMLPLLSQTDASVLLTGETGTGKDKIAEVIHQKSARSRLPFIKVNCGALPAGLLESELFGHVKGAFTGATRNKPGMFKLADRGTLFLTEIGDMPLPLQVKLLTFLDDRKFTPVGGDEAVSVDLRIIAATHRPLRQQVKQNTFREDLFYRLNVLHLHLPPLRDRGSDIPYLLDHFLKKITTRLNKDIVGFSPAATQTLLAYSFPGNIRELSNIVEYAVNICRKKKITIRQLPPYIVEAEKIATAAVPEKDTAPKQAPAPDIGGQSDTTAKPSAAQPGVTAPVSWANIERDLIIEELKNNGGNKTKTALSLGWGRMKLWRKMKQYQLIS